MNMIQIETAKKTPSNFFLCVWLRRRRLEKARAAARERVARRKEIRKEFEELWRSFDAR